MVAKQQLLGPQGVGSRQQHQQQQPHAALPQKRSKNSAAGGRGSLSQLGGMTAAMMMSPRSPVQQLPQQTHATQLLSQQVNNGDYEQCSMRSVGSIVNFQKGQNNNE